MERSHLNELLKIGEDFFEQKLYSETLNAYTEAEEYARNNLGTVGPYMMVRSINSSGVALGEMQKETEEKEAYDSSLNFLNSFLFERGVDIAQIGVDVSKYLSSGETFRLPHMSLIGEAQVLAGEATEERIAEFLSYLQRMGVSPLSRDTVKSVFKNIQPKTFLECVHAYVETFCNLVQTKTNYRRRLPALKFLRDYYPLPADVKAKVDDDVGFWMFIKSQTGYNAFAEEHETKSGVGKKTPKKNKG
jgi:hypothetical protein